MNAALRFFFAVVLCAGTRGRAQENTTALDIGVRSGIDLKENHKRKRDPDYAREISRHRSIYLLASVSPQPSVRLLIKEVNAIAIARELDRLLQARGFKPVQPGKDPQIVITVDYGRGFLTNPYSDDAFDKSYNDLTNSDKFHPWPVNEIFFSIGDEMKRQRADQEKLVIQVRAWRYPPNPNRKPELLWMTVMNVDDPDHRDLNEIYPKMLAAGAPLFDQPVDQPEVTIHDQVPEGHVKVGPIEVVKEPTTR